MNKTSIAWQLAALSLAASTMAIAQEASAPSAPQGAPVPVTIDNFVRAESDLYFTNLAKQGGVGKLLHRREPASIDNQSVIRLNRDTLYSSGVFDLDGGPVTITMPDPGKRFMSLQVISEDHYVPNVFYGAGKHVLSRENVGTRYVMVGIRTLVNPNSPEDIAEVRKLQDAIQVSQKAPGKLELPNWDTASQKKIRDALLVLAATMPDYRGAFGKKGEVDSLRHVLGAASGWGGNPDRDAFYLNATPQKNDGTTVYRLHVKNVPVDGFWSVSVYNKGGYFEKNAANAYTLNNLTAKKDADGGITVQFGGCDAAVENCLPIVDGWNYTVRLYRPHAEILNGKFKFPDATPVN